MRASIGTWSSGSGMVRTIIWRDIAMAPKDGRLIEVRDAYDKHGPKRTRWINGQWEGGWTPTHWRTVERTGKQWQGK